MDSDFDDDEELCEYTQYEFKPSSTKSSSKNKTNDFIVFNNNRTGSKKKSKNNFWSGKNKSQTQKTPFVNTNTNNSATEKTNELNIVSDKVNAEHLPESQCVNEEDVSYSSESTSFASDKNRQGVLINNTPLNTNNKSSFNSNDCNEEVFVSHEDITLSEEYLERCAVLVDLMPLLEGESFKDRTKCIVEGYFRVLNYPLSNLFLPPSEEKHILFKPVLQCSALKKTSRYKLVNAVENAIEHVHHIAPCFINTQEMKVESFNESRKEFHNLYEMYKANSSNCKNLWMYECVSKGGENGEEVGFKQLTRIVQEVINKAKQWCIYDYKPAGIAFLTTDNRAEEVRNVLTWMEKTLKVNFPAYRVFTPSQVMNKYWCSLVEKYEQIASRTMSCRLHSQINAAGNTFHCCERTVIVLNYLLADAAEYLCKYNENKELLRRQQLHLHEEEEEEEEYEYKEEEEEEQQQSLLNKNGNDGEVWKPQVSGGHKQLNTFYDEEEEEDDESEHWEDEEKREKY